MLNGTKKRETWFMLNSNGLLGETNGIRHKNAFQDYQSHQDWLR